MSFPTSPEVVSAQRRMQLRPATLIYNARAGRSAAVPPDDLRAALAEALYDADVWITASPDPLPGLLSTVRGPLFVAGGDGTLRTAALHLLGRTDIVLGVLPMGTANNVARALNVFGDVLEVARRYRCAQPVPFDVGHVRGAWGQDYFLEACGCGLFAEILDDYNPDQPKSPVRALGSAIEAFRTYPPQVHAVTVDGVRAPGPPLSVLEIMNTPSTGNGLHLAPQASPSDGLLDLVRINALARVPLLDYGRALLRGDFDQLPSVDTRRGQHISVADHGQVWHVDTDVRRSPQPGGVVDVRVWAGALRVLRPPQG